MVQQLSTKEEFDAFVSSPSPSIVHFSASFAPSCAQMNTFLDDFVAEFSGARCAFIDAEQVAEVSLAHKIVAAPTVILFKAGKSVARVDGYKPQEVRQHWLKLGNAAQDLTSRLKELVRQKPVMVFMKGNPEAPRCGFSRQTVELLKTHNIEYGSFDILSDEEVRQGLKEFSNWPTYPQLYFEGELIGGLDVLKEELQDADFVAKLPKKKDEKAALVERLKQLISSHKLMLFMKGNPQAPQCGFSRQIIALLNDIEAEYGSFDILSDNDVRQGLKEYSSWPTYPQLYLDGELVGGLDVVREELSDPDFVSKLPKKV